MFDQKKSLFIPLNQTPDLGLLNANSNPISPMAQSTPMIAKKPLFVPIQKESAVTPFQYAGDIAKRVRTKVQDFMAPVPRTATEEEKKQGAIKSGAIYLGNNQYIDPNFVGSLERAGSKIIKPVANKVFQGLKNISTNVVEAFRGMPEEVTAQQFQEILSKTRKMGVKKADEELVKLATPNAQGKINLTDWSKKVETQLVPLTPTPVKSPRFSGVGADFIGNGQYGEVIYQSPITTSAGDIHFRKLNPYTESFAAASAQGESFPNYFSHVRYEDIGTTRKILETQSDLMQKENFAREGYSPRPGQTYARMLKEIQDSGVSSIKESPLGKRTEEMAKLEAYSSNDPLAQLRTFREEVKRAAKDGKDTILIPSGETAMKIEGLGFKSGFSVLETGNFLEKSDLKTGQAIEGNGGEWVITDVLGDGKFKAVDKETFNSIKNEKVYGNYRENGKNVVDVLAENDKETFDISSNVDQQHFVYNLNESAIPKEARKMGLDVQMIIDKANGSNWWQIKGFQDFKMKPVSAFGKTPMAVPMAITGATVGAGLLGQGINAAAGSKTIDYTNDKKESLSTQRDDPKKGIIAGIDITDYATDPNHEKVIRQIYDNPALQQATSSPEALDNYMRTIAVKRTGNQIVSVPIKGADILAASTSYGIDPKLLIAILQNDSHFGLLGAGAKNKNPGNLRTWTDDNGKEHKQVFKTWRDGVFQAAKELSDWKINQ